jgi:ribosomal protein S18 acetylase RimI-like enzyme
MERVVQACAGDAGEILELQQLAYRSEALIYDDWSIPPLTQTLAELHAEFSAHTFLKLSDSGRIVGSVKISAGQESCAIGRLMVHPDWQGRGLGRALMQAAEARFPAAQRFELFTGSKSLRNIRLYERLGYRIFRTTRLSAQVELVFMEKYRN